MRHSHGWGASRCGDPCRCRHGPAFIWVPDSTVFSTPSFPLARMRRLAMPETIDRPLACGTEVTADIDRVCLLVPPLWELDSFVAVNPFLGFSDMPIEAALRAAGDALDANTLPSMAHYASLWRQGVLDRAALVRAAAACRLEPAHLEAMLGGTASVPMREMPVMMRRG
ncbi:MAG: DUF2309 family protein [Betaproteobacteria bacterium]|nr:DUF2309 family protein [Betaproteobacteria bacterium]